MTIRKVQATGIDALNLATHLLQRARIADPTYGIWEAADIQWGWRTPRASDQAEKSFWIDDEGPVAGVLLTSWNEKDWQIDPVIVPGVAEVSPELVWEETLEHIATHTDFSFDVPMSDDDLNFKSLANQSGFVAGDRDSTGWLNATQSPKELNLPNGFRFADRTQAGDSVHPMAKRNGVDIANRLKECSLYDPSLDLAIDTDDGVNAGYSLYWFDPVTKIGLVEPVRVNNDFQRRGLARAMVAQGLNRLVEKGAERLKVSWETEAAGALYLGVGFQKTSTTTWFRLPKSQ